MSAGAPAYPNHLDCNPRSHQRKESSGQSAYPNRLNSGIGSQLRPQSSGQSAYPNRLAWQAHRLRWH